MAIMQRPNYDDMASALRLRPRDEMPPSKVWLHVAGGHDTAILIEWNGHTIGWLSASEIAKVASLLAKNVQ